MCLLAEILSILNIWCGLCGVLLPLATGVWGLGWHAILSLIQHLLWILIVYSMHRETRIYSQTVHGTEPCIFLWQSPCQLLSPPLLVQPNIICCSNDPTTTTILQPSDQKQDTQELSNHIGFTKSWPYPSARANHSFLTERWSFASPAMLVEFLVVMDTLGSSHTLGKLIISCSST